MDSFLIVPDIYYNANSNKPIYKTTHLGYSCFKSCLFSFGCTFPTCSTQYLPVLSKCLKGGPNGVSWSIKSVLIVNWFLTVTLHNRVRWAVFGLVFSAVSHQRPPVKSFWPAYVVFIVYFCCTSTIMFERSKMVLCPAFLVHIFFLLICYIHGLSGW